MPGWQDVVLGIMPMNLSHTLSAGKYYWEVEVPGVCAMVGVGNREFDQNEYPGFDYESWGYG